MGWREKQAKLLGDKKVLVVGAGGIGCELLKNLVLAGFHNIHVIDLDTIDVSNLNRQFLFRREHVGKSKAEVASAAVAHLLPGVTITFDHASIFDEQFGLTFFQQFAFVMNALDNKSARTHVNRMCLAGRIPLIESGSAGYLGQVTSIVRDRSECFECVAKPAQQKTFPGCTIRNTPSEHIHCTVWAKHLFNQLFGEIDIDDDVSPDMNDEENKESEDASTAAANGTDSLAKNTSSAMETSEEETETIVQPLNTRVWAERVGYDTTKLFEKLFYDDINYLLKMENLWKERRKPTPLRFCDLDEACSSADDCLEKVDRVWTNAQCGVVFSMCVANLKQRMDNLPEGQILIWDKDDDDAMRFVAACANIRAFIFGIPTKTLFEIKSMAGNIIPAIATTNAVVAGMIITNAMKIVNGDLDGLRNVFLKPTPNPRQKILVDEEPPKPHPKCLACSDMRECFVKVNLHAMTVKILQDKVLKGALHMVAPDVMESSTSRILISSEEGETEGLENKTLSELSIGDGALLDCDDFVQKLELKLILQASDKLKCDEFEVLQDSGTKEEEIAESEKEDLSSRKRKPSDVVEENGAKRARPVTEVPV